MSEKFQARQFIKSGKKYIFCCCLLLLLAGNFCMISVHAEQKSTGWQESEYGIKKDADGNCILVNYNWTSQNSKILIFYISSEDIKGLSEVTITSSNPEVCSICSGYEKDELNPDAIYVNYFL